LNKSKEDQEDDELRQVLNKTNNNGGDESGRGGSLSWSRRQKPPTTPTTPTNTIFHNFYTGCKSSTLNGTLGDGDGDDEILESLVKTATRTSDTRMGERKRNNALRNSTDRKSCKLHHY
jgi:hypothetical protein